MLRVSWLDRFQNRLLSSCRVKMGGGQKGLDVSGSRSSTASLFAKCSSRGVRGSDAVECDRLRNPAGGA